MGYIRHHAIVVTGFDECLDRAHKGAVKILGSLVSEIIKSRMNGYRSFFVAPDGSKEGWNDSEVGDSQRDDFILWLKGQKEMWVCWTEVQYGDDEQVTKICRHSDDAR